MKTTNKSLMGLSAKVNQLSKKEATKVKGGGGVGTVIPQEF